MKNLIIAASMLIAASAHADDTLEFRTTLFRTVSCMQSGAEYSQQERGRSNEAIANWLVNNCGGQMGEYMATNMGMSIEEIYAYLRPMADVAIAENPRAE